MSAPSLPRGDILYLNRPPFDDVDFEWPVETAGIRFRNPFVVASGPTTMSLDQLKRAAHFGWAGASCKLTFDPPPYINRRPRYGWDHAQHLLYFTAEKRLTLDDALLLVEQARREIDNFILFSNFTYSGDDVEGWVRMAKRFEDAGAHINELNMCCPNMSFNVELARDPGKVAHHTGASQGQNPQALEAIIRAIKSETRIPLCIKLTPEGSRQHLIAKICYEAGADMVCGVGNRLAFGSMRIDQPGKSDIYLQEEQGLYCMTSRWLKPLALRDVYMMRRMVGPEPAIIGTGGVSTWHDAVEMILAGADLIGVCAATIAYGFGYLPELFRELQPYLKEKRIASARALRDGVIESVTSAPDLTLYEGYARLKDKYLVAPCDHACPFHVPAQAYVRLVAQERFQEAFEQITSRNPLQAVCGYVCNYPCEDACSRGVKDEPIQIRAIKRFVMDMADAKGWKPKIERTTPHGTRVAVIGSGPAGLTAAQSLARAGYTVDVYEQEAEPGGMLRYGIPAFRLPRELLDREVADIAALGVTVHTGVRFGREVTVDALKADGVQGIVLAFGTQTGKRLQIPGEVDGLQQAYTAIDFLKAHHRGEPMPVGDSVVIVGGGFTAVDAARTCIRRGVPRVMMVYRRTKEEMTSIPEEVYEAEEEGVRVMYLVSPVELLQEAGQIHGIRMAANVLGMAEESGRRKPEAIEGAAFTLPCDTLITAISQSVEADIAALGLPMTAWGTLDHDARTGATDRAGLVVGGDAAMGPATVIRSIAQGYNAAVTLDRQLRGDQAFLAYLPEVRAVDPQAAVNRNPDFPLQQRFPVPRLNPAQRRDSEVLYEQTLSREAAVAEAKRCLFCGCGVGCQICEDLCLTRAWRHEDNRVEIDAEKCVACGICLFRCPNQNIDMVATEPSPKNTSLAGKPKIIKDPAKIRTWSLHG